MMALTEDKHAEGCCAHQNAEQELKNAFYDDAKFAGHEMNPDESREILKQETNAVESFSQTVCITQRTFDFQ